jgi:hypothetical protein
MVRYGMVRYGMVRYGKVWYGKVWYGMLSDTLRLVSVAKAQPVSSHEW